VLHYVDGEVYGGCEEAALHLMASLDRARYDPVLLHHSGPGAAPLEAGAARLGIPMRAVPRPVPGRRLTGALALWRAVRAVRPAIVHVHLSWPLACRYGVVAARLAGVPAVGTAQLYLRPGRPREARLALSPLRRIIAVSEEVRSRYERELGVGAHRLVVVRNGIMVAPTPPAPNAALRAELVQGRPDYLVFTPARLHPQKGHAYLLEAAALVPEVTLVLAGDGPLRGELEDRARELGIAGRCLFLGHRTDVAGLLAVADLFVLPSLFEGLPVSVLEAMAAGRPVIATRDRWHC
jgi:glycosyltransferase involved in cell wall biosynthesis